MKLFAPEQKNIKIKVCGISSTAEIDLCHKAGVNAVGLLVYPHDRPLGKRSIREDTAVELINFAKQKLKSVLLVKYQENALELIGRLQPDVVQMQKEACNMSLQEMKLTYPGIEVIKTYYIKNNSTVKDICDQISKDIDYIDAVNLDSARAGRGEIHDWNISSQIAQFVNNHSKSVVLAGGLSADNLTEAIQLVKPDMVDIMSWVRSSDGNDTLEEEKIHQLIKILNHINQQKP